MIVITFVCTATFNRTEKSLNTNRETARSFIATFGTSQRFAPRRPSAPRSSCRSCDTAWPFVRSWLRVAAACATARWCRRSGGPAPAMLENCIEPSTSTRKGSAWLTCTVCWTARCSWIQWWCSSTSARQSPVPPAATTWNQIDKQPEQHTTFATTNSRWKRQKAHVHPQIHRPIHPILLTVLLQPVSDPRWPHTQCQTSQSTTRPCLPTHSAPRGRVQRLTSTAAALIRRAHRLNQASADSPGRWHRNQLALNSVSVVCGWLLTRWCWWRSGQPCADAPRPGPTSRPTPGAQRQCRLASGQCLRTQTLWCCSVS